MLRRNRSASAARDQAFQSIRPQTANLPRPDPYPSHPLTSGQDTAEPQTEPKKLAMESSETEPIRHPSVFKKPLLETPLDDPELDTPHAIFFRSVKRHPGRRCLAYRRPQAYVTEVVKVLRDEGEGERILMKEYTARQRSVMVTDWIFLSYGEVEEMIRDLSIALTMRVDGRLHMYAKNSYWWWLISQAAALSSIPLVTVYTKVTPSILLETLTQTESVAIYTDSDMLETLLITLIDCPLIKTVIYHNVSLIWKDLQKTKADVASLRQAFPGVLTVHISSFIMNGTLNRNIPLPVRVNNPNSGLDIKDQIWGISYPLADSSVKPKGVLITTCNMVASIASVKRLLNYTTRKDDKYLSYLPLSFLFEYALVNAFFGLGITVGFATNTVSYLLPSPFSNLNSECAGDIETFAPSILFGIPSWWDEIHEHVLELVKAKEQVWQDQFWKAVARKKMWLEHPVPLVSEAAVTTVDNTSWIRAIRQRLFGKRIRWVGVSCAFLAAEKRELLGLVLSATGKMVEAYSMMELSTVVTFTAPNHFTTHSLGPPTPSVEMRLVTVYPHYIATSSPARGEIQIRGPSVPRMGFHADPKASAASFLNDGWVRTGDIGEWDFKRPGLRIIDRLKPLDERIMGEYVPIERLERVYELSGMVNECCLVYSGLKTTPIAIINTNLPSLQRIADFYLPEFLTKMAEDDILLSVRVMRMVTTELNDVGRENGLVESELIGGVILTTKRLPRKPKPKRSAKPPMGALEVVAADSRVRAMLDRERIGAMFEAELEVIDWVRLPEDETD